MFKASPLISNTGISPFSSQLLAIGVGVAMAIASATAAAQDAYPDKPIRLIVPYPPGGATDVIGRVMAQKLSTALGQTVVVDNRAGATGNLGAAIVAKEKPDGYTLLLARTGSQAILPAIMPTSTKYKWDDYTFIGTLELNPYGCVVNAKSPYKNFDELATALRTKGKTLNFGTAGSLTTNDMGPRQLFKLLKLTDQVPTQIGYKGTGDAVMSLLGGETEFACGSLGPFLALMKAGRLRAMFVTNPERMTTLPDVPTARELGYPEMEAIVGWSALYGPAKLPADVRDKLVAALKVVATDPAWLAGTAQTGSLPYILSPDETKEFARRQHALYRTLGEMMNLIDSKAAMQ